MNNIDLIIILIILIFMLIGSLRGFISTVIGLVEYVLSIFLAYKLSPIFAKFMIEKWAVDEKISSAIYSFIPKMAERVLENSDEYKDVMTMSGQDIESISETLANTELPFIDTIVDKIIQIFAIIILFIVFKFIFRLASFILNRIAKLPVLKEFNKIGGMVVGFIEGVVVSLLIIVITSLLPNENLQNDLANSFLGNKVSQVIINKAVSSVSNIQDS